MLQNKAEKYTKKYVANNELENDLSLLENQDDISTSTQITNNDIKENEITKDPNDYKRISFTLLGEIMMGGQVTQNLNYIYSAAFKNIYYYTKNSDFTFATLGTNITNLDKIEDSKSKYLVTKDVINGISALGIDSVSVATDHMIDFSSDIFNITKSILKKYDILIAGQKDIPVYFEKGNQRVAIVSTNAVILGTSDLYSNLGISVYEESNFRKNIREAKKMADVVIADIHWGKEYEYGVTSQMTYISHIAIDEGADLVIGSHAVGVYPVITYKEKPIIFSAGSLISDSDLYVGKESFIFDLVIENKKIISLTMIPTYVDDKREVKLYNEYDSVKTSEILEMYNKWHIENGLDSKLEDNKLIIEFD